MQSSRRSARGPVVAGLVLLTVLAVIAGLLGGHALRRAQVPLPPLGLPSGAPTPTSVAAVTGSVSATASPPAAPVPTAAGVAAALAGSLADGRLGPRVIGRVTDVVSGAVLFDRSGDSVAAPASTAKLTTAAAVLTVRAVTDRITTTVTAGPTPDSVVLVGGGDPTLSAAAAGTPSAYPDAARIADLATQVQQTRPGVRTVYVDGSLFTGAATGPGWDATDAPSEYASPITAAMVDGGRDTPTAGTRSADPAAAAGQALAGALGATVGALGVATVAPGSAAGATAGAAVLATVQSAPIGELVEQMLQDSDNVLAEVLARQVALAGHQPASFEGAAAAVRQVVPAAGPGLVDGSGLSRSDQLSPDALTAVLRSVATTDRLRDIVEMLPVGGWNGTLADRYLTAPEAGGAGRVRAKTGTLTGVSSLAGVVDTADGRVLAFALIADQIPGDYAATLAAEPALDAVAATLAGCGCR